MKYIISGGLISIVLFYVILMALGSLGAGNNILELLMLLILMALPGMIAGVFYAVREKLQNELDELKRELAALQALLERRDSQEKIRQAEQIDNTPE